MARYTDADCKRCRREKMKLFLKGSKCESPKCPFEKRPYPPGQHGRGRSKESEYLLQLREKQKATRMYGVLEKQFSNYYKEAQRQPGKTGEDGDQRWLVTPRCGTRPTLRGLWTSRTTGRRP